MENPPNSFPREECGSKSITTPAYFVILQQSQGNGKKEEGIVVANRDVSSVAPVMSSGHDKSKSKTFLSAECKSGNITLTLDNNNMWNEFYRCSTEMVLTKQGRRMFPYCRYWISGLDPYQKYILVMDISPMDNHRYKWNGKWWEAGGKSEPHVLGRVFIHPESPSTGQFWMHQPVSFYKLKLTNNILDQEGHIILHSMHRYLPRLHLVPANQSTEVIQLNGPDVHTFTFPQTEFIAVTAYQNFQITQLKIDCNPFAKGFREGAITGKPVKEAKSKNSDQENDSQGHKSYNDSETLRRLRELFRAPENSDGDTEPEALNAENAFLNFKHSRLSNPDTPNIESDGLDSPAQTGFGSSPSVLSSLDPKGETNIVIKEEPVDDYDYSQEQPTGAINVKQESEEEETDEYSNSDDEYPILERHFSQFRKQPHSERKRSASSPTGVAKAKMLKLNSEKMPVVYLESCSIAKSSLAVSTLEKTIPREKLQRLLAECRPPPERELCTSKHITTEANKRNSNKGNDQNLSKNKADTRQITVSSSQVLNIGSKKPPIVLPKSALIHTTGLKYNLLPPVKNKRGRPRKQKHDEAEQILPDVNPDLEDVDGVLFVAFSSKEALDVHTEGKPKTDLSSSFLALPASGDKATINKIRELEKHLVEDLQTMKYNQVIHPALQQVGLKLNIVDPTMSIDLRYLGVQLPLPYITRNVTWDSYESCAQASRSLFVSRTGKTTDYTKIKGWKDKFSTSSMPSSSDNHISKPLISGKSSESSLKNRSAFCSDELDEYLENEARLMETSGGITQNEREPPVISWLPAESTSSVKNIDTLLQRQISEPSFSSNASKTHAKRKRTKMPGKASTPKTKAKQSMESENIKGNPVASETGVTSIKHLLESDKVIPGIPSLVPSIEETLLPSIRQVQLPNQQPPLRSYGFSKAHMKLLDMEESTLWKGKPRTYITEERADIGLVVLLTAQASLKNKQIHKVIRKQPAPCNKLFCRLGCVCQSLNHKEHSFAHCRRADCMLDCSCIQKKQLPERDEMQIKVSMACTEQLEEKEGMDEKGLTECMEQPLEKFGMDIKSSAQCSKQLVEKDISSIRNSAECMEQLSEKDGIDIDLNILADCVDQTANQENPYSPPARDSEASVEYKEQVKTVKTQSSSAGSSQWYSHPLCLEQFPIWKRGEEEADSEPICIPKQSELEECKVRMPQTELQHSEKHTSPVTSKNDVGSSQPVTHKDEPVYVLFDSLMTCARVRIYERKPPEEKAKLELCNCESPDANEMDHSYKRSKSDDNYKTNDIIDYIDKNTHNSECFAPTKLIEIISDCSWEEDRSKILNIVSQHMNKSDSQSFKVGSFNIELTSENKDGDNATTSTYSSRVKISMVPGQMKERDSEKSVKWKTESIKLPECKLPEPNVEAEQLQKSHGGKGLPFYTKIIPAGKLVAQLKNPNERESELVQVNGKYYPQAKVLLGQMGALHPANRLAAYITHRLRPGLFNLSKLNEVKINAQSKDEKTASSSVEGKFKENPSATLNVKPSITKNIVSISVPSTSIVSQLAPKLAPASTVRTLGSSPSLAGTNAMPTLTLKPAISQATSQVPRTSVLPAGIENRLGPRLLLIPVQSGSTPVRPVQPIPQTPGQKMILQPIRSPGKLNLFRHPNGQIIQLVPLQQVRSTNVQPSNQPLVVRKKSDTIPPISAVCLSTCTSAVTGVRLQTKSETFATAPTPTVSASLPSVSVSTGSLGSLSKICSVTTAVSVASAGPPFLSQLGTLKLRIVPPISSDAENQSNSKVITCASEGQSVSSTNVLPLQSGSFSLLKLPSQTAESSPVSDITISQASNTVINTDSKSSMPPEIQGDQKLVDDTVLGSLDCTTCDNSDPGFSKPDVTGSEVSRKGNMSDETSTSLQQNGIAEPVEKISEEEDSSEDKQHSTEVNDKSKTDKQRGFNEHDQSKEDRQHSIEENDKNKEGKQHVIEEHDKSIDDKQHGTEKLDKSKEVKQHSTEEPDRGKEVKQHEIEELDKSKEDKQHVIEEHGQNIEDKQHSIEEHNQNIEDKQCGTEQQDKSKEDNQHGIEEYDICKENKPHPIEDLDNRKDKQHSIGGHDKSEEDKQHDIEEQEKNKDPTVDSGFPKPADEIQLEKSETLTQDPVENLSQCYTDQKSLSEPEQEASAASFLEENPEDSDSSICKEMFECITRPDSVDSEDSKKDTQSNASLDNENSEIDEAVDIETVEELSEKINIARLKASASNKYSSDKCSTHAEYLKARKKLSKDGDMFMREMEEDPNEFHRRTHTANERRRRNEMRDLFEELKNALGLHNLPKVSKSYILKQAIEEIEGLTDLADTLIRKKTLLSQRQNHLLKKVSNLSGKTKDVILKKLEYIYAKQKAMEAERKKKNLEEDIALHKASMINAPLQKNMSLPPMGNEEAVSVQLSGKSKKPIILAKKTAQASIESKSPQQISITASNLLMTPQGQLVTLKNPVVPGHVAAVQSTVIQAEMSPQVAGAVQQGIASVVIQLPGTIQVKGLLGNASIPITLAAVPNTSIAGVPPPTTEAERDDLSMMPKIVNVTSLAHESSVDLDGSVGLNVSLTDVCKNDSECPLTIESSDCGATSVQGDTTTDPVQKVSSANPAAPTQPDHLSEAEDGISQLTNHVSDCIESSLIEHITQEQFSQNKEEMSVEQKLFSVKDSTCKANKSNYEHSVELESNKVASGIDDPDLETSELIDVIGDHEDTDETITSLLNELAFLNQQLNTDDLDSGSDFPGSETASRGSASKFTEGDSSPFSFGRLKELSEMKEKNVSLSPLFLQLEEGEIQEGAKQNEEPEMVPFLGSSSKESLSPADGKTCSVPDPSVSMPSTEMSAKQETLWRPMPKLAPLGLKAAAISADQKAHGSRSMPTLAPVNMRLNPPKSSEEQSKT
ncbi:MAX gene-associated protein isoform X2 [Xenopus laevis]|uniref:MAX gene-associated protein n=1 Tax=Xenopus laevis TaxID=8355 RepID=A0A8J0TMK4_XENLA|nr:MAX gene-associated protein isoform X2 [Xenopus laevis]